MFTGIITDVGVIARSEPLCRDAADAGGDDARDRRIHVRPGRLALDGIGAGDSIAVNGVCLTAVAFEDGCFLADVSCETLSLTNLGALGVGSRVNLEPALRIGDPLGGHLVSGHVDGLGEVLAAAEDARSWRFRFAAPAPLLRYVAVKGSICVDGVSLTVNAVDPQAFEVNIVPHTFSETVFADYRPGTRVNLEVDQVARYLERLLAARDDGTAGA